MKYCVFIFFISFFNCKENDNIMIKNDPINFQYKYTSGIKKLGVELLEELNRNSEGTYKLEYINKQNTTIFNVIDTIKEDDFSNYKFKTYWNNKAISNINCKSRITITNKELSYIFCYDDVLNHLNSKINTDYLIYNYYEVIIDSILTIKSKKKSNETTEHMIPRVNSYLISDLLKNIPFNVIDNYKESQISSIAIGDFDSSSSGGSEHYVITKENDTIAYFYFTSWEK